MDIFSSLHHFQKFNCIILTFFEPIKRAISLIRQKRFLENHNFLHTGVILIFVKNITTYITTNLSNFT